MDDNAFGDNRAERALSFGQVAESYDRWRPGYPDGIYDAVLGHGSRILEAGAGTGRATVGLAERGASVFAVEPDPEMAAVAARRTEGLPVEVEISTFEDCAAATEEFDVVACAQAWHWVDPVRGPEVAARALRPGGVLALWWNRPRAFDGPVWDAIHDAYAEHAPALARRDALHTQEARELSFEPVAGFGEWDRRSFDWTATYDAESYTGLVGTHSDHLRLPEESRKRLVAAISEVIDAVGGGQLEYRYRTILVMADRAPQ